ncbi:MAG TPA: hypothetical protein VMA72_23300 [Streptosporangiaceae bacterium]|nr:hypothetical protein [Streptosporangiaceae bacterium]
MTSKTAEIHPDAGRVAALMPADIVPAARARNGQWLLAGLLLSGAAQLIDIAVLTSADRLPASWWALLLAIAPAPLAAVAAFATPKVARLAVVTAVAVLVAGIVGGITHNGLFFAPALVALVVGGVGLWRAS